MWSYLFASAPPSCCSYIWYWYPGLSGWLACSPLRPAAVPLFIFPTVSIGKCLQICIYLVLLLAATLSVLRVFSLRFRTFSCELPLYTVHIHPCQSISMLIHQHQDHTEPYHIRNLFLHLMAELCQTSWLSSSDE